MAFNNAIVLVGGPGDGYSRGWPADREVFHVAGPIEEGTEPACRLYVYRDTSTVDASGRRVFKIEGE